MSVRNKITLIGNVGKDPEVMTVNNGTQLAKFSLATTENWKDKSGEWQQSTDWHNIEAWGNTAGYIERNVHKGAKVAVVGSLHYDQWEKDGVKRTTAKIKVSEISILEKVDRSSNAGQSNNAPLPKEEPVSQPVGSDDDDLPF